MSSAPKSILVVFTSCDKLLTGGGTGYYLPEAAHPYWVFKAAGFKLTSASPKGGVAPLDQGSAEAFKGDEEATKFLNDAEAKEFVANTLKLSEVNAKDYDAVFYVGGHGPVIDLTFDESSKKLIREFYESNKPTSLVCHAPAVLRDVTLTDGTALVSKKNVTGFSNQEEEMVDAVKTIPFLLESALQEKGAIYSKAAEPWASKVVVDGNLLTGQNPASAGPLAEKVRDVLLA